MHCINMMPKAIRPGLQKGATILIGGKAPILKGANLSWVLVPFMEIKPPYSEVKDLLAKIWDWWDEHGKTRERLAELILRMGLKEFLKAVELPACAPDGHINRGPTRMCSFTRRGEEANHEERPI